MIPRLRRTGTRIGYPARANLVRGAGSMLLALLILTSSIPARAASGPAVLVKGGFSSIGPLVNARGTLFFVANSQDLWTSDGTLAGTKQLRSGSLKESVKMSGKLYFISYESASGWELWRSDGTVAGTTLLKDIYPGSSSAFPYGTYDWLLAPFLGAVVSGYLYFVANDGVHGLELWRTDGTTAGTTLVSDLTEGAAGSRLFRLSSARGQLFFVRNEGESNSLWRSDGTDAGTIPLAAVVPKCLSRIVELAQTMLFTNFSTAQGCGLWASDGTQAGTRLLKEIPNVKEAISYNMQTTIVHGSLFFIADWALWRSDGTPEGTVRIKELFKISSGIGPVINAGETLFFLDHDAGGASLWRSDGTLEGTRRVTRLLLSAAGDSRWCFSGFTSHNGFVFFNSVAEGGESGCELWRSDGTEAGTVMVKDLVSGPAGAYTAKLTNVNGVLVFVTTHSLDMPISLAKSDGTSKGTIFLQDLQAADIVVIRSLLLVSAYNNGRMELWAMPLSALGIKFAYLPSIKQ
jgi:trimeric autotransporter adhesin